MTELTQQTDKTNGSLQIPGAGPFPVTYGELRQGTEADFEARQLGQAHRRNLRTALNAWMKQNCTTDSTLVGPEFGKAFDDALEDHKRWLAAQGLSERTIRDRGEFLCQWLRMVEMQRQHDTLPGDFSACLALLTSRCGISVEELSQKSGLAPTRLLPWVKGEKRPWRGGCKEISALENSLGVPRGTLAKRLPRRRLADIRENGDATVNAQRTTFQRRMSDVQRSALRYRLKTPSARLLQQWRDWVQHKTAIILMDGLERSSTWRLKPLASIGQRLNWSGKLEDGQGCPTAQLVWSHIASYLGFLSLSQEEGGLGQPTEECHSLTLLSDTSRIYQYIEWRRRHSENKMHRGILLLVTIAASLVKPKTGYLWQRTDWADHYPQQTHFIGETTSPLTPAERIDRWHSWCERNWEKLIAIKKSINAVGVLKKARDPKEALGPVLSAERPVDVVLKIISVMEEQRPPSTQVRARAIHIRDVLLLKMLISNPLRVQHFSTMVFRPNGQGNIYRTIDGAWRLRFEGSDFKNTRGAACDDYDVTIPCGLWPEIEEYISTARPTLLGNMRSNYFFVSGETGRLGGTTNPDGMWTGHAISSRVRNLWRIYMDDIAGYGPHGFRAIVATDYLKRFPGDYPNVARLLHDKLDTVLREYSHLNVEDGLKRLHAYVESYWANAK